MTTYTWTDNTMRGGSACDVDKVADNLMHLKYDNTTITSVPFALNSGNVTNGESDLLSYSGQTISTKTGGSYPTLIATNAFCSQIVVSTAKTLDMSSYANGNYNIFLKHDGTIEAYKNTIFKQKVVPTLIEESWTRPNATADTTSIAGGDMVCSSSGFQVPAYSAIDGSNTYDYAGPTPSGWWKVVFPYRIRITGLVHLGDSHPTQDASFTGRYYTSSAKTVPIGDAISAPTTRGATTPIQNIPSDGRITDTIYCEKTGGNTYSGIGNLLITATKYNSGSVPLADDIWVDTSVLPLKAYKYDGTNWITYTGVQIGTATITSSAITAITNAKYNQNGITTASKYDSGWFPVIGATTYTKTHNLGTSQIKYTVLVADDVMGTNSRPSIGWNNSGYGFVPYATTNTALNLYACTYPALSVTGAALSGAYFRIIAEVI